MNNENYSKNLFQKQNKLGRKPIVQVILDLTTLRAIFDSQRRRIHFLKLSIDSGFLKKQGWLLKYRSISNPPRNEIGFQKHHSIRAIADLPYPPEAEIDSGSPDPLDCCKHPQFPQPGAKNCFNLDKIFVQENF